MVIHSISESDGMKKKRKRKKGGMLDLFMAFKKAWRTLVLFQMNLVCIENLKYYDFESNLVKSNNYVTLINSGS